MEVLTVGSFLGEALLMVMVRKLFGKLFSPELSGAGFGTEHEMLIGRLTDIHLAGKTGGLSDRALRYLHEEIQDDERSMPDRFVDLVHEFRQRSRAATQARSLFPGPATQVRLLNPGPRLGLMLRLMKEIIGGGKSANSLALINLSDVDSNLEMLNNTFANLLEPPEVPPSYATERHLLVIPQPIHILRSQSLESEILGRDDDKEMIWQIISSGPSDGVLFVPISGMPGSGKTTLGRLVYNDPRVKEYFDCRMWVAVPRKFDIELIVMKIIRCVTRSANHMPDLGYLRRALGGRKFFLVLDDVWSRNEQVWELVKSLLSVGRRGSAVIVTTTQSYGGPMTLIEPAVPYMLKPLPEDICFKLLVNKVSGTENNLDLTAFSEIVKQIVQKCHGVPLAINMIGGMLPYQPENAHGLLQSLDSCTTGYLDLFTLIKFSYQTLPSHLQLCILYLTLFPSDYTFDRHEIIDLWNAMGFISCTQQGDNIENYGDHCIDILVSYCFLQEVQYLDGRGNLKYHISSQLYFVLEYASEGMMFVRCRNNVLFALPERISHLSLLCDENTRTFPRALFQENNLRTLLLFREGKMDDLKQKIGITRIDYDVFLYLGNLRVLDLHSCAISKLPNSILLLAHLRYLNLSETNIKTIPKSMTTLRKLQVLNLSYCKELRTLNASITRLQKLENLNLQGCCKLDGLPENLCYVRKLRHLNVLECSLLTSMPCRLGQLSHLQTLPRYIATAEEECTIGELQGLANLKGALQIENLEKVLDTEDAKRAQLNAKRNITSLALHWSWLNFYNDDNEASDRNAQQVLEALQPPPSLEMLNIFSYPGRGAPEWMTNGSILESMVEIRLVNLKRLESLPPLGLFPCLKVIEIRGVNAVTCVDDTFSGNDGMFPKLEKLTFSQMPNLEKWVMEDNQNKFPCLRDLTVAHCPKLKVLHFTCSSLKNLTLLFNIEMLYSTPGALKYFGRSLRKLTIGLCCELVATSTCEALHDLTALEELEISECDQLISLPEGMRHLTCLHYLTITNCRNLETLPDWLWNSASKPKLSISGCPKFDDSIKHDAGSTGALTCLNHGDSESEK